MFTLPLLSRTKSRDFSQKPVSSIKNHLNYLNIESQNCSSENCRTLEYKFEIQRGGKRERKVTKWHYS